jgi:uncharacterized protein
MRTVPAVEPQPVLVTIASATLLFAVLALWTTTTLWLVAVTATVVAAYVAGTMHGLAVVWLGSLAACAWHLRTSDRWPRAACAALTLTLAAMLGAHVLPGFTNPVIIRDAVLNDGALPYRQYVNFDKGPAGLLLLGCAGWVPMHSAREWTAAIRGALPVIAGTIAVTMAASLALGYVRFDPRWTPLFVPWAAVNLLLTCVSEEAFFRGIVQRELTRVLPVRLGATAAVAASAVLFGLVHAAGGWRYVLLATMAGAGYGLACQRTGRLEMAILAHFAVNAAHFLLFTYPAVSN